MTVAPIAAEPVQTQKATGSSGSPVAFQVVPVRWLASSNGETDSLATRHSQVTSVYASTISLTDSVMPATASFASLKSIFVLSP